MRFVGIDPSTKTGLVIFDEYGAVSKQKEITGIGDKDPKRVGTLVYELMDYIQKDDFIVIEGFPYSTQKPEFTGGLHGIIKHELWKRNLGFKLAAPNAVKKYVDVTGWTGEPGEKERLKGADKKAAVKEAVIKHYQYTNPSDNIIDAYILARIALDLYIAEKTGSFSHLQTEKQIEVIDSILNPKPKEKPKKPRKKAAK
jgi:crossover junction endodeoxyribonuclease RuvC